MAKNTDFTGEIAKKSISEILNKVIAYHSKYWREGNELKVRDYTENLCSVELEKYLSYSKKDELIAPLCSSVQDTSNSKYTNIYERYLLQYGPYIMTLALEYASARGWKNRYLVSDERRQQLIDEDFHNAIKDLKKIGLW